MKEQTRKAFREKLILGIDSLIDSQADILRKAVEAQRKGGAFTTAEEEGNATLLVAAGLLRRAGGVAGLHKEEFYYQVTPTGQDLYNQLFES
jgi:hypothetical protein